MKNFGVLMQGSRMGECLRLLLSLLREIGDENAYHRHLTRAGVPHSAMEWRRFCDHHLRAKYQRGKCC